MSTLASRESHKSKWCSWMMDFMFSSQAWLKNVWNPYVEWGFPSGQASKGSFIEKFHETVRKCFCPAAKITKGKVVTGRWVSLVSDKQNGIKPLVYLVTPVKSFDRRAWIWKARLPPLSDYRLIHPLCFATKLRKLKTTTVSSFP